MAPQGSQHAVRTPGTHACFMKVISACWTCKKGSASALHMASRRTCLPLSVDFAMLRDALRASESPEAVEAVPVHDGWPGPPKAEVTMSF